MKPFFILALIGVLGFTACKKDANETGYTKSYSAWQSFKKASNNSYYYTATFGSWAGFSTETKITVSNGEVIARDYKMFTRGNNPGDTLTLTRQWHEDKATLNMHSDATYAAVTLDEIYLKAKNDWLRANKKENEIYFEAKNNGLISTCGYVPNGCQDDCFSGITIKEIVAQGSIK